MTIEVFFRKLKDNWRHLATFVVWSTLAIFFLRSPPGINDSNADLANFGRFIAAIFISLVTALCIHWSNRKHKKYWIIIVFILLVSCVGLYLFYSHQRAYCTCSLDGKSFLIGRQLTEQAFLHAKENLISTCGGLIQEFAGAISEVWTFESVVVCGETLLLSYIATVLIFIASMIGASHLISLIFWEKQSINRPKRKQNNE